MRRTIQVMLVTTLATGCVGAAATTALAGGAPANRPVLTGRPCAFGQLRPAITDSEGAAGSTYLTVKYTNTGWRTCAVEGFPAVAFVDRFGRQIGATAADNGTAGKPVRLLPRGTTTFIVRIVDIGLQPGCTGSGSYRPAAGLRIVQPGAGGTRYVPVNGTNACVNRAVQQLSVSALGS